MPTVAFTFDDGPGAVTHAVLDGLRTVRWDVDPRDHEEPGAGAIHARTMTAIRPGSIVLLHVSDLLLG